MQVKVGRPRDDHPKTGLAQTMRVVDHQGLTTETLMIRGNQQSLLHPRQYLNMYLRHSMHLNRVSYKEQVIILKVHLITT